MGDTSLVFNLVAKERVSGVLKSVKEKFTATATAISAGVGAALSAGIASNLDAKAAAGKLQAQLGVGAGQAAELSKVAARVYADAWGESTEQVNDAVRNVYQNIGDVSAVKGGLQGVTTKVIALSQTFDQDLGGTTAAVGQMLRTGLAKDANEALDILTRGFQSGTNKADDLLDTLNEYGVQFKALGLNGQMATGLLSQGLKGGARDADLVADSLKEFNLRARDITSTAPAGFKALGLNAKQMAADVAAGGPKATQALQMTLDALRKYPDTSKKASIAAAIFGTQSEDMQKALMSLDPSHAVQALGKVGGAADQMSKTLHDNPQAALEEFKRSAMAKLASVTAGFIGFATKNKAVVTPLATALAAIAATVLIVRGATAAWTAVQTVWSVTTRTATAVQWAWNAAMDANPIGLIIIAVAALVAIIVLIATKTTWFQTIWRFAWGGIKATVSAVWGWIKNNWPLLLAILTGPIGWATLAIVKNWGKIKSGAVSVYNWIKGLPGRIGSALAKVGSIIASPFRAGFNAIARLWNGTVGRIGFTVPSWVPGLGGKGFSFPQIPYLAKGGVIERSGLAMVGERGPEVLSLPAGASVTPLPRGGATASTAPIDYDRLADALTRAMRREGVGATYLDGQKITDNVSRRMGRATDQRRRTG